MKKKTGLRETLWSADTRSIGQKRYSGSAGQGIQRFDLLLQDLRRTRTYPEDFRTKLLNIEKIFKSTINASKNMHDIGRRDALVAAIESIDYIASSYDERNITDVIDEMSRVIDSIVSPASIPERIKISIGNLRKIIREELFREARWKAWRMKQGKRQGEPIEIDATSTSDAAEKASKEYEKQQGQYVDQFTIDIVAANPKPKIEKKNPLPKMIDELSSALNYIRVNGERGRQAASQDVAAVYNEFNHSGMKMFIDKNGRPFDITQLFGTVMQELVDKSSPLQDLIQDMSYILDCLKRGPASQQ